MQNKFLVRVSCMTYNHASYIEDAMNGFCMQETNFPFVCTIMDDASTDGEPEVIRKYLQEHFDLDNKDVVRNEKTDDYVMTFAQHKINKNCYFAVYFLKYNHYKKKSIYPYIREWMATEFLAFCEGDDYWIHPYKLRLQIDYMNSHPDTSATFGNYCELYQQSKKQIILLYGKKQYNIKDVMAGLMPGIQNLCIRTDVNNVQIKSTCNGDMKLYYRCAMSGNLSYLNENFSIYRKTGYGIATKRNSKEQLKAIFSEEYQFHKDLGFPYNSELVKYQMRILYNHLKHNEDVLECLKMIKMFRAPHKLRYLQYFIFLFRYIRLDLIKLLTGRRQFIYI